MTPVSVSIRSAHDTSSCPEVTQRSTGTCTVSAPKPICVNTTHDSTAEMPTNSVVMISLGRGPNARPSRPAISAPMMGRKTMALYIIGRVPAWEFGNREWGVGSASFGLPVLQRPAQRTQQLSDLLAHLQKFCGVFLFHQLNRLREQDMSFQFFERPLR